jgi:hypothetical protein
VTTTADQGKQRKTLCAQPKWSVISTARPLSKSRQTRCCTAKVEIDVLKRRLKDANEERRKWKPTAETYARAIQVLTLEKSQLQQSLQLDARARISLLPNFQTDHGGDNR